MTLDDWRKSKGLSYSDVGRLLGKPAETARRYCLSLRLPASPVLSRIATLTDGQVQPNDFHAAHSLASLL